MNIMTIVRYRLKSGFEDEFIKAINAYNYSNSVLMRLVSISNGEYLSIMEYDEIDKTGDDEISGVEWLDSIEHMLEFFDENHEVIKKYRKKYKIRFIAPNGEVLDLNHKSEAAVLDRKFFDAEL